MASDKNVALRKRQQIENASKRMFVWVAVASAILAIAAVLSLSLFERLMFNQKIINAKNETIGILRDNNEVVDELKANVRVVNTNQALNDTQRVTGTEPLSVILDALPSKANSSALGASLQQRLLDVGGITIDSLTVDPISGVEDITNDGGDNNSGDNEITFEFVVTTGAGEENNLREVLRNLERSIRVIDLTSITIEQQGSRITMTAEGKAFYQPEKKVELTDRSIRP